MIMSGKHILDQGVVFLRDNLQLRAEPRKGIKSVVLNRIYVTGFGGAVKEEELIRTFKAHGRVLYANIVGGSAPKRYGFVTFDQERDVTRLLQQVQWGGLKIYINDDELKVHIAWYGPKHGSKGRQSHSKFNKSANPQVYYGGDFFVPPTPPTLPPYDSYMNHYLPHPFDISKIQYIAPPAVMHNGTVYFHDPMTTSGMFQHPQQVPWQQCNYCPNDEPYYWWHE
uniref:uncharacterized protein LOC120326796 n=1 Tax=Styela clava TaxID=7725 RepID=UPI0019395337|nr:uncharacterized protein LOC120326796 [Styela clava]